MQSFFDTLKDALGSENLIDSWPVEKDLYFGETHGVYSFENDSIRYIEVTRFDDGSYSRPEHYVAIKG